MREALSVYYNPGCSKSRALRELLHARGIVAEYIDYLARPPTRPQLELLLERLGTSDPRVLMRTGDALYAKLGLAQAEPARLLDALAQHPSLLERPIAVLGAHAVIARPPEKVLELLAAPP